MSRIRKFYARRFRELLGHSGASDVEDLFARAEALSVSRGVAPALGLALVHADLRRSAGETARCPHVFVCDAGLGGLARWLRGAGYEASWNPELDDPAVIREAQRRNATLITTDSLMMERGVLRDGIVPSVFVPSSIDCDEQFLIVLRELSLPLRDSRCMNCGGMLRRVEKASVADRIPPKTALWLDDYFVCSNCGQLFWRGTHWRRIVARLRSLNG